MKTSDETFKITAQQLFHGLPLRNGLELTDSMLVPFQGKDVVRWGMVRRYGNRNWFHIAKLANGTCVQINKRDNQIVADWLDQKRKQFRFWNPRPSGRYGQQIFVQWLDEAGADPSEANL